MTSVSIPNPSPELRDYALIEANIAKARQLRSDAVAEGLASAWSALERGAAALADLVVRGGRRPHLGSKTAH